MKPVIIHKCKTCGTDFSDKKHPIRVYCSRRCAMLRVNNPQWKGDDVGYKGVHNFIPKIFPKPKCCMDCGKETKVLDLANISGGYKREISDWEWLCRRCHMVKDGRMKNLKRSTTKVLKPMSCQWCKILFQPTWRGRKYCSKSCAGSSIRRNQLLITL